MFPSVVYVNNLYHMWYASVVDGNALPKIGYATSPEME
jgi:hypothetical protein